MFKRKELKSIMAVFTKVLKELEVLKAQMPDDVEEEAIMAAIARREDALNSSV